MSSKQYFENVAENWDKMRDSFFPESIREKAIIVADLKENSVVADIGAGTGFVTEGLLNNKVQVIAVDQSDKMLQVMREKFKNFSHIEYRLGNSDNLPFANNEIDVAFANMYLHHVDNPQKAIAELFRVLKKGGKLIITDLDKHNHEFLLKEHHDKWMGFDRLDIKEWFNNSGFLNVEINCVGDNCCTNSETSNDSAEINVFIAIGQKQ